MENEQQRLIWPSGQPFDMQRCLFAPSPKQIGRTSIASSTLKQNQVWLKVFSSVGLPFRHTLGYLGEAGIACFECDRDPGRFIRREVLVFAEAASLFARSTAHSFEYLWKDHLDRLIFRFDGSLPTVIPDDHIFRFLVAAEAAWTQRFLENAADNLGRGGSVEFPILGQGTLRLSRTSLSLGSQVLEAADLKDFSIDASGLEIRPSLEGEMRGIKPIRAAKGSIGNAEALYKLLTHALNLRTR